MLDLLDPEQVFALGMSDEPVVSQDLGRMVYTRNKPEELLVLGSALMYSVLNAVGESLKPPDSESFVVVPKLSQRSSFRLPLMARYGGVNDAELESTLNRVYSGEYRFDLDLSKSVRVEEISVTENLLGVLTGDLSSLLDDDVRGHALTLPKLTLSDLQVTSRPSPRRPRNHPADGREWARPIVVTGSDDSVEDFALFWDLRAEHYSARPFPMWIPIDLLEDAEAPTAIEKALERVPRVAGQATPRMDDVLIASTSMDATELQERLGGRFAEACISADNFIGLFNETCEYYYTTEKLPAHFDRGRTSIQPPRPEHLKNSLFQGVDYVAYEVGVDGMWLPQAKAMAEHLRWPSFESRDKVSKRGNLRYVKVFNKSFSESDIIELRTPDGWTLLSSLFEERGYDVVPTDKAEAALGLLNLIGGPANLRVIASSKVRELLQVLSRRRGEKREFFAKRKTLKFEHFRGKWGGEAARDVLRWLVERRVVFRGAALKCPRCRLDGWYAIDRVGEVWRCDGCQEDLPIPLEPDKTEWHYRINELYAHGHDQGTLTPLLTLYAMHTTWSTSSIDGDLGFYPGVELRAKEGADVKFDHKEIDLVAMRGGDLILAECKESAHPLSESGEAAAFARQLKDLVELADHLEASKLLVASSTAFPEDKAPLLCEALSRHSVEIIWLDGRDLLDPDFVLHPLNYPQVASQRTDRPEGLDVDYLDWVRRSVTNQDV
jgi:hypothetical protein